MSEQKVIQGGWNLGGLDAAEDWTIRIYSRVVNAQSQRCLCCCALITRSFPFVPTKKLIDGFVSRRHQIWVLFKKFSAITSKWKIHTLRILNRFTMEPHHIVELRDGR